METLVFQSSSGILLAPGCTLCTGILKELSWLHGLQLPLPHFCPDQGFLLLKTEPKLPPAFSTTLRVNCGRLPHVFQRSPGILLARVALIAQGFLVNVLSLAVLYHFLALAAQSAAVPPTLLS